MTLSTLLVHLDDSTHAAGRYELAAKTAAEHGARLIGLAPIATLPFRVNLARALPRDEIEAAVARSQARAREMVAQFETIAGRFELPGFESRISELGVLDAMSQAARYADLVVVSQDDSEQFLDTPRDLGVELVMQSGRPVLIVSRAWRGRPIGQRVAAAWDGSREATRALTDALPILRRAAQVDVLIFNSSRRAQSHGEEPGADIGLWLTRHRIKVNVIRSTVDFEIGSAMLSQIADLDSDLVVMGGYGHSRLRESLFGGVTRTMLESMTVPVLMSH
ncbi:MAG: universal stress protein [Lautropia sp.]